jgi:hypothetical protein
MDGILTKEISVAASEREALFLLLGRMEQTIIAFRSDYDKMCQQRAQDVSFRQSSAQKAAQQLEHQHQAELARLRQELEQAVRQRTEEIARAAARRQELDSAADAAYNEWESKRSEVLTQKDKKGTEQNRRDEERLNQMLTSYHAVTRNLKDKYPKLTKNVTARIYKDPEQARKCFDAQASTRCRKLRDEILLIQGSAMRSLFQGGKRDRLCRELEQLVQEAKEGVKTLKGVRQKKSDERWNAFAKEQQKRQNERRRKKQTHQRELEQRESVCQNQIQTIRNTYAAKEKTVRSRQNTERMTRERAQKQELAQAKEKWEKTAQQDYQRFAARMEEQFPAQKLLEMLRHAWSGQQTFAAMPQQQAQRNVLVGIAYVNAKGRKWYDRESGALVRRLMAARYPFLFQQVRQQERTAPNPDYIRLPYKLSLERGENLLLRSPDALKSEMEGVVHGIAMHLLWGIPAGQSQFLLADAAAIGSFAGFAALDPAVGNTSGTATVKSILDGDRICSSAAEIRQRIQDNIVRYNSSSGQMGAVRSLREYNLNNPMNHRNFLIAVLLKFPLGLDETSIQSLRMMGTDCGKWGYSSVLSGSDSDFAQADQKLMPALNELTKNCLYLKMLDRTWFQVQRSRLPMEMGARVWFYPQPDEGRREEMKKQLREEMVRASSQMIDFEKAAGICPPLEKRYTASAREGIVVPVGYWDGGAPFHMIFDDSRVHAIINGDTGSGKTNLLHVLITNTMLRYAPEEVEMYLIDFKHGTEFRRYTNFNLPAFRAISLCNEPEFALKMLQELDQELQRRATLFGDAITNLKSYSQQTGKRMSRILVIVDELFELISEAKDSASGAKVKEEIMKLLQKFAIQSRAYGIHMVISGQNLTNIPEVQTIKNSCETRIALRCSEQQVTSLINQAAADQMRLINAMDKGACVVRAGQFDEPKIEHTAYLEPDRQHIRLLQEIHGHFIQQKQYTGAKIMVTDVQSNLNNLYQRYLVRDDLLQVRPDVFYLGEVLSVHGAEALVLTGKNLWIVGGQSEKAEQAGKSLCFFLLLSLLLQKKAGKQPMQLFFCNGGTSRQYQVGENDRAGELGLALSAQLTYVLGDQMPQMLQLLYQEMAKRKQSGGGAAAAQRVWVILQRPEDCMIQNGQVLQMLQEILQYGPEVGIQTILWTANPQKALQMQLHQVTFGEKIALEMESSLYTQVLGTKPLVEPKDWYLTTRRGVRMRVYDLPEKAWTERMIHKLSGK